VDFKEMLIANGASTLSPRYRVVSFLECMIVGLILWGVAFWLASNFTQEDSALLSVVSPFMVKYLPYFWLVLCLYRWFSDAKKGYWITDEAVSYRVGWFTPSITSVPVKRIQHIEVMQGAIGRLFKLHEVKVLSAGRGVTIPGLTLATASSLRNSLLGDIQTEDTNE